MEQDFESITRRHWQQVRPEIERHFALLWQEPELPGMEFNAALKLSDWLQERGFQLERAAFGIPTAFIARRRLGAGPRLALLAEYDALPGTGNAAVPAREPDGKRAGHACGHNQIGPANIGAAIAAAEALTALKIPGELLVIGCPAEEIVWGKVALLKLGAFEGVDAILTSHGDYQNGAVSRPCQSVIGGEFLFLGESGHGGRARRRNALDAAELAVQSVERLRAHHFPDVSVEHVLRVAGHIPNVTADEARLWFMTRHVDYDRAREVYDFVEGVSAQAAKTTDCAFKAMFIAGTRGYLPNDTLAEAIQHSLQIVGPPRWTPDGIAWMEELAAACRPGEPFELDRGLALHHEGVDPYGQDDGEASWRIPLGRANWAIPTQVPLHNWAATALAGHPASFPGPLMVSEALALTTVGLLAQPQTIEVAQRELRQRVGERQLSPPALGALETLTQAPERFWDASWRE